MTEPGHKTAFTRLFAPLTETFGLSRSVAFATVLITGLIVLAAVFWFIRSAPPHSLIITSGPEGSAFSTNAAKYAAALARSGVRLKILSSEGSLENLKRLGDSNFQVDIGFVQGGVTNGANIQKLSSLGSIAYQPLLIFYRSETPVELLSGFSGQRLTIGPAGSGTHLLALTLLAANGIEPGSNTTLLELDAGEAAKALVDGKVDAVFLMGDSASSQVMRQLLRAPQIHLFDFTQADAYTRKITYLNKLVLPKGSIDFGKNLPNHDITLIGPTVELVARESLHPAMVDLLLDAARDIHGNPTLLQRRNEFPAPLEHDFKINPEAARYYRSGKSFLYRSLPFLLASIINRVLVAFVPMVLVLIPALRVIPVVYKWRTRLKIFRWYRALLVLERESSGPLTTDKRKEVMARLEHIEKSVNVMKVPASFADQFYGLRGHIDFVRDRVLAGGNQVRPAA